MSVNAQLFSIRLAEAMQAAGENKLSLGKKIGVAHTTVAGWLKGAQPGIDKIKKISQALSVDAHWLLGETEDAPHSSKEQSAANDSAPSSPSVEISVAKLAQIMATQTQILERMLEAIERLEGKKLGDPPKELRRRAS